MVGQRHSLLCANIAFVRMPSVVQSIFMDYYAYRSLSSSTYFVVVFLYSCVVALLHFYAFHYVLFGRRGWSVEGMMTVSRNFMACLESAAVRFQKGNGRKKFL
jgi:hypothetical protein